MSNTQFRTYKHGTRMQKKGPTLSFGSLFFVLILLMVFAFFFIKSVGNIEIVPKAYRIDAGASAINLSQKLGWDVAAWRYKLWVKFFPPENLSGVKIGEYEATRGDTIASFFEKTLKTPTHTDLTITILPGWNMYDIDAYLSEKSVISAGDFLRTATDRFEEYKEKFSFLKDAKNLEGFLYPDTYRVSKGAQSHEIILKLLQEFQKKVGDSYESLGDKAYEKLILASIVEREERDDTNQPIVAGILEKRVQENIAIGADATVCIGYAKTQKQCTPSFIGSVIHESNPYNTRAKKGYPPTPISNVPLSAWDAARDPEASVYYYYLHDNSGEIHFARTLDEHVKNRQQYGQ